MDLQQDSEVIKRKIDQTREDVRTLHPLMDLLAPGLDQQAGEFVSKLMSTLIEQQEALERVEALLSNMMTRMMDSELEPADHSPDFRLGALETKIDALLNLFSVQPEQH